MAKVPWAITGSDDGVRGIGPWISIYAGYEANMGGFAASRARLRYIDITLVGSPQLPVSYGPDG